MGLLAEDQELKARVTTARTLGISLKRFEGWEPVTVYQRDDAGRVTSSRPEVEWDDDQQGWMLALSALEFDKCGGCGGRLSETTASDVEYVPNPPIRCHKCTALHIGAEKSRELRQPHALLHTASKRED